MGLTNESARFSRCFAASATASSAENSSVFLFPLPPLASATPHRIPAAPRLLPFAPNPLAHLSVTRGGGLPRSLNAVQIIVIDLEAAMQPFSSRTPFSNVIDRVGWLQEPSSHPSLQSWA
jgi:hypothetical protein